jgi:hypothetical protein
MGVNVGNAIIASAKLSASPVLCGKKKAATQQDCIKELS